MAFSDLPALLRLVDDPSPLVSRKVAARLHALGEGVWRAIEEEGLPLSPSQRTALELALAPQPETHSLEPQGAEATHRLQNEWLELLVERDELRFLQGALGALSSWQRGSSSNGRIADLLDELAENFRASGEKPDAAFLARFLFDENGLRGADASEFTDARSSDLLFALEEGAGLPITLACAFILVGARLGITIEGCNFPGHFLTRDAGARVFDPFNGGRLLSAREVAGLRQAAPLEMSQSASSRQIIARVLRNLSVAFHNADEGEKAVLLLSLLHSL